MKTSIKLLALASGLCMALPFGSRAESTEYTPVKFNENVSAVFPQALVTDGVRSGAASVAIAIDENGQLSDMIVTGYSHPRFAESALAAIKKWTFEPMRIRGVPRNSITDITFHFEVEGVVVASISALDSSEIIWYKMYPGADAYSIAGPAQLSQGLKPSKIINPEYGTSLARSTQGGQVIVDFYVDDQGHVRMPSVSREVSEAHPDLAAIAVSTMAKWEFEPPMSNGRPVLVRARQAFNFKPPVEAQPPQS
jgi:TonB family protein